MGVGGVTRDNPLPHQQQRHSLYLPIATHPLMPRIIFSQCAFHLCPATRCSTFSPEPPYPMATRTRSHQGHIPPSAQTRGHNYYGYDLQNNVQRVFLYTDKIISLFSVISLIVIIIANCVDLCTIVLSGYRCMILNNYDFVFVVQ